MNPQPNHARPGLLETEDGGLFARQLPGKKILRGGRPGQPNERQREPPLQSPGILISGATRCQGSSFRQTMATEYPTGHFPDSFGNGGCRLRLGR